MESLIIKELMSILEESTITFYEAEQRFCCRAPSRNNFFMEIQKTVNNKYTIIVQNPQRLDFTNALSQQSIRDLFFDTRRRYKQYFHQAKPLELNLYNILLNSKIHRR